MGIDGRGVSSRFGIELPSRLWGSIPPAPGLTPP